MFSQIFQSKEIRSFNKADVAKCYQLVDFSENCHLFSVSVALKILKIKFGE